jgi:hypothetical protein
MNRFSKVIAFLLAFIMLAGPVFAADPVVIEPYTKDEFPQWAKDLRRTEIITFGSLPFVTLTVTLAYSLGTWAADGFSDAKTPDLFSRTTSSSITDDEQMLILGISAGISIILGLVDLFINLHQRKKSQSQPVIQSGGITVTLGTEAASSLPAQTVAEPEAGGNTVDVGDDSLNDTGDSSANTGEN